MSSKPDEQRLHREQRDALQQIVDCAISRELSDDPRSVIHNVTVVTREWIWAQPRSLHRILDDILASSFVGQRYGRLRRSARPGRHEIAEREVAAGGQLPLPQMNELIKWRWASRNGKVEKSVWHSTLPELDALDADYEARQIDMAAKRRYLLALRTKWRQVGSKDASETVEQFYERLGAAA